MKERKVRFCPYCGKKVWGEGFEPKTGELYFSHVNYARCCYEIAIKVRAIEPPAKEDSDAAS